MSGFLLVLVLVPRPLSLVPNTILQLSQTGSQHVLPYAA